MLQSMNLVQFAASLSVKKEQITALKGDTYVDMLTSVAESFRDQFDALPENITSLNIQQETDLVHTPAKTSWLDLFVPFAIMKNSMQGYSDYGSNKHVPNAKTIVTISGSGPRGGRHSKSIDLEPQALPPLKERRFLLFFKKQVERTAEDLKVVEKQLNTFFETLVEEAKNYSQSRVLLGKRAYEALQEKKEN